MIFNFTANSRVLFYPGILTIAATAWFYFQKINCRKKMCDFLSHPQHQKLILKGYSKQKTLWGALLFFTGTLSLLACILRPSWGEEKLDINQNKRSVLFALDISRSMLASDVSPTRLELAKLKIKSILEVLGPERVGLLLFSGNATLQCPFTSDFKTFGNFLNQVDNSVVSSSAQTSMLSALGKSIEIFNRSNIGSKILIMITDGEEFSQDITPTLNIAKKENIALLALGAGTAGGAPVPIIDGVGKIIGHEKDNNGSVILTKLDEEKLNKIVSHLGGKYQKLTYVKDDVLNVKKFVEQFEKEKLENVSFSIKNEAYPYFALLGGACLLLEALFC